VLTSRIISLGFDLAIWATSTGFKMDLTLQIIKLFLTLKISTEKLISGKMKTVVHVTLPYFLLLSPFTALYSKVLRTPTHTTKTRKSSKIVIKLMIVQNSHENEMKHLIMYKVHNN
jgi:hypothetical protein